MRNAGMGDLQRSLKKLFGIEHTEKPLAAARGVKEILI
jgi:hypothetical protein